MTYVVRGPLGRGGMGVVELATDPEGREVALKRVALTGSAAAVADARSRIRREADVLERLDHPGIVELLDVVVDGDDLVLVMPVLRGGSLADRVAARGLLSPEQVDALADHLLAALAAAHRAGVVHRDVKPSNVLFDEASRPVLADFGVAVARDATAGLTRTGGAVGTPAFVAPEQARGEAVGPAADVFALGATLLWAATGTGPWGAGGPDLQLLRAARGRSVRLPSGLPPRLRRRLATMLDPRPERRPTAAALRGGPDGTAVRPTAHRVPLAHRLQARRRALVVALGVLVVLGFGGALLAATILGDDEPGATVAAGDGEPAGDDGAEEDACVDLPYQPCGERPAPGTDGRRCVDGRVDLDDDPTTGCEAIPDGLADGAPLDGELRANLVPADEVDVYELEVDDRAQLLCDGRITLTLTSPAATTMRLVLLDPDGEERGQVLSADGDVGELVFRERDCGGDEGGTYTVEVSLVAGSAPSADDYVLTESGSL